MDSSSARDLCKSFPAGTVLFKEGDEGRDMYVIQRGAVRLTRRVGAKDSELAVLPAGEFFGEMAIINNKPRSATATVVEDAQLMVLDGGTFEAMIRGNAEVAVRMIKRLADRLERANQQVELLLHRDPNHRVVQYLRKLAEDGGEPCPTGTLVHLTEQDLAARVGLGEEQVAQVVKRLELARLLSRDERGNFVVSEVGKLQEFLDFLEMTERFGG